MERLELERRLEQLHLESWGWALACCARDRELAADVLQTAYLRVLSGAARFREQSSFKSWLFGVIRMTAANETRRVRSAEERRSVEASVVADPGPAADVMLEHSEERAALLGALAQLSNRQREVLQLVFYHDMTIQEAAQVMDVSLGSARTHYERGKHAVARILTCEHIR